MTESSGPPSTAPDTAPPEQHRAWWIDKLGARFALTYFGIAAALFTIYAFPFELFGAERDWLHGYLAAYARMSGALLSLFDSQVTVTDTFIYGRYPLQIVRNCDAVEINILFASAVLAFPAPLGRRLLTMSIGLLGLVAVNVTRICCLYFIGVFQPSWFAVAHEEVWPLVLVIVTVILFLLAARYMQWERRSDEPALG